ncbi:MAG: hypothetical protein QM705_09300 [Ancrocorticia sp.]
MASFMDWVLDVAAEHPDLAGAFVTADGHWLDIILPDGRTFRFRPSEMITEDKPEEVRRTLLNRLIAIGVTQATGSSSEGGSASPAGPSGTPSTGTPSTGTDIPRSGSPSAPTPGSPSGSPGTPPSNNDSQAVSDRPDDAVVDPKTGRSKTGPSDDVPEKKRASRSAFGSIFDAIMGAFPGSTPASSRSNSGFPPPMRDAFPKSDSPFEPLYTLPIVRAADYFLAAQGANPQDSMVFIALTDFIGVGLGDDNPDTIDPIFYSDLEERYGAKELGEIFTEAVEMLREFNLKQGNSGLELGMANVSGARVFLLSSPHNYQSSWFADLDMIQTIADSLTKEYPGALPLFVPASRTSMFVVMADDPSLPKVFNSLRGHERDDDAIYPLPHTVASDGWSEWIPMPDHPAANRLSDLRTTYRERIYDQQIVHMEKMPGEFGALKSYDVHHLRSGAYVSNTQWTSQDSYGSVPDTDFITFIRHGSGMPWDEDRGEQVSVRARVAREVWSEGFRKVEGAWPTRWEVLGFPGAEKLAELREASGRDF